MVALERRVNEEKLRELLGHATEAPNLDFKETCDLRVTRDCVELAKDIGSMQVDGGYIVIGADSTGALTGRLTDEEAALFDDATLRDKVAKWIPPPLDLLSAIHSLDTGPAVVIFIGPSPKGMCIFKADGQFQDDSGATKQVFRAGDVFVRDGTQSRRWQQPDIDRIVANIRSAEKNRWLTEIRGDLEGLLNQGTSAQALAGGPAAAFTWQVDEQTFDLVAIEHLRAGDLIPLTLLLERAPAEVADLLATDREDDAATLLDRLACLLGLGVRLGQHETFDKVLRCFVDVYNLTFDADGRDIHMIGGWGRSRLHLEVLQRVMAAGALAVRKSDWNAVTKLALQRGDGEYFRLGAYTNWVRHGQVSAARAELVTDREGLLSFVAATAARLGCLHVDIPDGDDAQNDRLLNSVIQFDALAMLAVLAFAPGDRDHPYYPSFARYYWHRFDSTYAQLLDDPVMRASIHPGTDEQLRTDIIDALAVARSEGFNFGGGGPLVDRRLIEFLDSDPEE